MMEGTVQLMDEEGNIIAITSTNKDASRVAAVNAKPIKAELGLAQGQYIESNGQLYQIVQVPAEEPEVSPSTSRGTAITSVASRLPAPSATSTTFLSPLQNVQTTSPSYSSAPSLLTLPTANAASTAAASASSGSSTDSAAAVAASELRSKRHEILSRRPSYRKILNELSPGLAAVEGTSAATPTSVAASSVDALTKVEHGTSERSSSSPSNSTGATSSSSRSIVASTPNLSTSVSGMVAVQTASGQLAVIPASSLNLGPADFSPSSPNTLVQYATTGGAQGNGLVTVSAAAAPPTDGAVSSDQLAAAAVAVAASQQQQQQQQQQQPQHLSSHHHSDNHGVGVSGGGVAVAGSSGGGGGGGASSSSSSSGSSIALPIGQRVIMTSSGLQLTSDAEITGRLIEDTSRKREVRLFKNREAARECRRKKKEYVRCLENRVAVLENQNKALIEELKSLKDLYCNK